jgi:glutaminase
MTQRIPGQAEIEALVSEARAATAAGSPADYIPALSRARPDAVGLALCHADGRVDRAGDADAVFTVQSVSKALALPYVLDRLGEEAVFSRVGKEPTGDPFNSIIRLEASSIKKPYNPMINAGAIVVTSLMPGRSGREKAEGFFAFAGRILWPGRGELPALDEEVRASESSTANRNRSIAWFLRELGMIEGEVEEVLDAYFRQCSMLVDAVALSRLGACLALDGLEAGSGERLLSRRAARVTKALMLSCGLYDGSGEFCVDAGMPAKSGVGGGIVAAVRGRLGIGTYGPALDARGNSIAGTLIIKALSESLDLFEL